jgi:hypothetical protein
VRRRGAEIAGAAEKARKEAADGSVPREEVEVSAQQLVERHWIDAPTEEEMSSHEARWQDFWHVTDGMPSRAEVAAQLRRLRSSNRPGTEESAVATNERAVKQTAKAGEKWCGSDPPNTGKFTNMVGDGAADARWASRLSGGEVMPPPFLSHGSVGRNGEYALSGVRE